MNSGFTKKKLHKCSFKEMMIAYEVSEFVEEETSFLQVYQLRGH
jgi:hypothetical protein